MSCSCLCPVHWRQVLSWEWRCSWSSADRRCSNYIWVILLLTEVYLILEVGQYSVINFFWVWIKDVTCQPLLGLLSWYPVIIVKTLQLIWRSGTRRWNLREPDLQMSHSDLTKWEGTNLVAPVMVTGVTFPIVSKISSVKWIPGV